MSRSRWRLGLLLVGRELRQILQLLLRLLLSVGAALPDVHHVHEGGVGLAGWCARVAQLQIRREVALLLPAIKLVGPELI